jgi:hypothetical protein
MSKPNLLGFASSVGIYRNKRIWDLSRLLSKSIPRKVEFSKMAPMLFQATMAYAAENQIDGNFHGYTTKDWTEIFAGNNVQVTPSEASEIVKGFHEVGLFEGDKIRSWMKFNRHLADYEGIVKRKRKAAKEMHRKREQEAQSAHVDPSKNGEGTAPKTAPKPVQKDSASKQLWVLDQALKGARGGAKKALLIQREELLSQTTGVDLSQPSPSPAPSAPAAPKLSAKERQAQFERGMLAAGKACIDNGTPELLTEQNVIALLNHGYKLPAEVERKFRKLISANPVPE